MRKLSTPTRIALFCFAAIALFMVTTAESCDGSTSNSKQAEQAVKTRSATFDRAEKQAPVPNITTFPRRKTLVNSTLRESQEHHPWYVYVLGLNGNVVNYFVAKSIPVNDCDYLSSTEAPSDHWDGTVVLRAPSLSGIFQSSSGCNTLIFFDLTTDAEIRLSGLNTFVTDRPLRVEAEAIRVRR